MKSLSTFFGFGTLALSLVALASAQADLSESIAMTNLFAASTSSGSPAPIAPSKAVAAVCPRPGPYFSMEYLYWKVEEEQLYAGATLTGAPAPGGNVALSSELKEQKFEFTSGFRATVGYDLPYEHCDVFLAWTRIHPKTTKNLSTTDKFDIISPQLQELTDADVPAVESIRSKWHLAFDMLDLGIGRKFVVGKRFSLRPNFGVKGGWINQTQNFKFTNATTHDMNGHKVYEDAQATRKSDFQGIGPLLGLDLRCGFGPQFGIFSSVSGALLYGHFNLKDSNGLDSLPPGTSSVLEFVLKNPHNRLTPFVQMLIGGDWSCCLYQKWMLHFSAAYETQYWWNIMGANTNGGDFLVGNYHSGGDLMMHGLTLQARFDF